MVGLWVDDDLQIHPDDIEFGFTVYKQLGSQEHRIVGYSGRQIIRSKQGVYTYKLFWPNYSMVLTNAAFLDVTMLDWFWSNDKRLKASIAYVDKHMNCEDILMNCKTDSLSHGRDGTELTDISI